MAWSRANVDSAKWTPIQRLFLLNGKRRRPSMGWLERLENKPFQRS